MVYLPMCYLYCMRYSPDVSQDPLLQHLREELYLQPYEGIDWDSYRQTCAPIDEYSALNPVMKVCVSHSTLNTILSWLRLHVDWGRCVDWMG